MYGVNQMGKLQASFPTEDVPMIILTELMRFGYLGIKLLIKGGKMCHTSEGFWHTFDKTSGCHK